MTSYSQHRSTCRLCTSTKLERVLQLTPTPPANAFVTTDDLSCQEQTFSLDVYICHQCSHVQLLEIVDPSYLFENYVYVSGTSASFRKHFELYAAGLIEGFSLTNNSMVVDIGSNDGTLLKFFKQAGHRVLGIDPAKKIAEQATTDGIPTIARFFTPTLAGELREQHGPASVITANNVFAHIDDLDSVVEGVKILLEPEGIFVFEVSYLGDVFEKILFDTIYHEHLSYHSVIPLVSFFNKHQMKLIDALRVNTHGGSLRCIVARQSSSQQIRESVTERIQYEEEIGINTPIVLHQFNDKINLVRDNVRALLQDMKKTGKRIAGFGAPAKATTLMYHFGIDDQIIKFIVDDNPLKQGLYTPGMHIPVLASDSLYDNDIDVAIILAWNFAEPIMRNHAKFIENGGQFIVPLPTLKVY